METQESYGRLNYDFKRLDEYLSKVLPHHELRYWLNEIESELLAPDHDGTELAVDNRVWEVFKLLKAQPNYREADSCSSKRKGLACFIEVC